MTTQNQIFDIILNSNLSDWQECSVKGTPIHDIAESPNASISRREVIYYKGDVNIRFEFRDVSVGNYTADWVNDFPDTNAKRHEFVLYYGETPIKVFILVAVDGDNAYLPVPKLEDGKLKVSKMKAKVAEIYDHESDHYYCMRLANFIVED